MRIENAKSIKRANKTSSSEQLSVSFLKEKDEQNEEVEENERVRERERKKDQNNRTAPNAASPTRTADLLDCKRSCLSVLY